MARDTEIAFDPALFGLSPRDVPGGLAYGLIAASAIVAAHMVAARVPWLGPLYRQPLVAEASPGRAAFDLAIRIPLGTALLEELIFRGVALSALSANQPPLRANIQAAALFGIWHVDSAIDQIRKDPVMSGWPVHRCAAWVAASVLATGCGGVGLGWLRTRSRSLVAPWLAHTATNDFGFLIAWWANRRPGDAASPIPVLLPVKRH